MQVVVSILFPVIVIVLVLSLNFVAVLYASSAAIPFGTMVRV